MDIGQVALSDYIRPTVRGILIDKKMENGRIGRE